MSQKSYDGKASLYLIPTPIGNLDDITIRAVKTLGEVSVVFAEDTRVTQQLLKHLNIDKKIIANHEHNEEKNKEKIISLLMDGNNVGLVSDRGTPVISDPGYVLAKHVIESGYNVIALPGPTALIPALITSGLSPMPFMFFGFLNSKPGKRKKELKELINEKATIIFYEAPHRITKTLEDIYNVLGNRKVSVSREISKKFEEIYRGNIVDVIENTKEVKGEIVIVVEGNKTDDKDIVIDLKKEVNQYVKKGYNKKDAIKMVADEFNINKNKVYNEYHNIPKE